MASCDSDQTGFGVAQMDESHVTESPGASDGSEGTMDMTDEEITVRFSACMREHGFESADPTLNADGTVDLEALKKNITKDPNYDSKSGKLATTLDDCVPLLANATFTKKASPENEIELQDNLLMFAQCLRDEGLDTSDPDFSEGGENSKDFINNIKGAESKVQRSIDLCTERIFGGGGAGK
jgi:hypothetical protein